MEKIICRMMKPGEEPAVCGLVRRIFEKRIAQEFEAEGVQEFFRFADPEAMRVRMQSGGFVFLALQSDEPVGMLEFAPPDRIAMLFVQLEQQGIAKALLARTVEQVRAANPGLPKLTVHSSHYAEPIYRRLGFVQTGDATTEHGITYLPMQLDL